MSTSASPQETTSANGMSTASAQPPLPPAHLFDILPPLHALLSRLEPNSSASSTILPVSGLQNADAVPLSYKEIGNQSQFLKTRIRKAMAECAKLGDLDRTVEQQEREIQALEKRIGQQKEVLAKLAKMASDMEGNSSASANGKD